MRKRKPDLMVVLAALIGFGVLVTEMAHGEIFGSNESKVEAQR